MMVVAETLKQLHFPFLFFGICFTRNPLLSTTAVAVVLSSTCTALHVAAFYMAHYVETKQGL